MIVHTMTEQIKKNSATIVYLASIFVIVLAVVLFFPAPAEPFVASGMYRGGVLNELALNKIEVSQLMRVVQSNSERYDKGMQQLGLILGAVVVLTGTTLKWLQSMSFRKVYDRLDKNDQDHVVLGSDVEVVKKSVSDYNARANVMHCIRETTLLHLRLVKDTSIYRMNLRTFMTSIGTQTEDFAKAIMNERLDADTMKIAYLRAEAALKESQRMVVEIFKGEAYNQFLIIQKDCTNTLLQELQIIADDTKENHKYKRFNEACNKFLDNYLPEIVYIFMSHEEEKLA